MYTTIYYVEFFEEESDPGPNKLILDIYNHIATARIGNLVIVIPH